jgi:DNA-binding MarR family transcriptional regulator
MGGERQGELIVMYHMAGRTVQVAIDNLNRQGLVIERNSLDDARKRGIYLPIQLD